MKFFLRWATVLATLIIISLSSQIFAAAYIAPSQSMQAEKIEKALDKMADKNNDGVFSEKEMKRRTKLEKRYNKMSERIEKRMAKRAEKGKKTNMEKIPLGLILMGAGVVLWLIAAVSTFSLTATGFGLGALLGLLGSLAFLAGVIFLILGLIENA